MKLHPRHLAPLAASLALAACMTPPPGTGVTTTPLSPAPGASAAASPAPGASPTAPPASSGPLPPGVFFRDDFDGDRLDPTRWQAFEREGRVLVSGGKLELLQGGTSTTYPMVVPLDDNIPKTGPYYVEIRYELSTSGRFGGFNLDYLPPQSPDDQGITEPFMYWASYQNNINFRFRVETTVVSAVTLSGSLRTKTPRRFRLEFDGNNTYRVVYDNVELNTFQSRRRPARVWFGAYPNEPAKVAAPWANLVVDAIETGLLVAPDPASPRATPTPKATTGG